MITKIVEFEHIIYQYKCPYCNTLYPFKKSDLDVYPKPKRDMINSDIVSYYAIQCPQCKSINYMYNLTPLEND